MMTLRTPILIAGLIISTAAGAQTASDARAALARLGIPEGKVAVTLTKAADARYRVQVARDRVAVTASSPVAAVRGVTALLERQ